MIKSYVKYSLILAIGIQFLCNNFLYHVYADNPHTTHAKKSPPITHECHLYKACLNSLSGASIDQTLDQNAKTNLLAKTFNTMGYYAPLSYLAAPTAIPWKQPPAIRIDTGSSRHLSAVLLL